MPRAEYWRLKRERTPEKDIAAICCPSGSVPSYLEARQARIEDPALLRLDAPLPLAAVTLASLAQDNRLILLSLRREEDRLRAEAEDLGLAEYFVTIIACYRPGLPGWRCKADAMWADGVCAGAGGLIVGDTEDEVLAGRHVGIAAVAVQSGIRTKEYMAEMRPTALLASIADLPTWLGAGARPTAAGPRRSLGGSAIGRVTKWT